VTPATDTEVGIIGAGPAGLVLSHLLARRGIDSVVLEARDRAYVESRVRAGVLEHGTVALLDRLGLAERLHREGLVHTGVLLQFEGRRQRIDLQGLTGRHITVYGQQELVKDLIAARVAAGGDVRFGVEAASITGVEPGAAGPGFDGPNGPALIRYRDAAGPGELRCRIVAGCDGFHGVSRAALPASLVRAYEHTYPFAWLGILADVAPSTDELLYSFHRRGFALHSLRSATTSRLYLQVAPDEDLGRWPDDRIWGELGERLGRPGWSLREGPVLEKGITPMRSFVAETMSWGRLYLAGDAAHIVPPTGAKGLNLAVADVVALAAALHRGLRAGDRDGLDGYAARCLRRVWRVQDFSALMTGLTHLDPGADGFGRALQRSRQDYVISSEAMRSTIAENYVGLPLEIDGDSI
jgi:p-hydroxybenzoate 3-monooxygenase